MFEKAIFEKAKEETRQECINIMQKLEVARQEEKKVKEKMKILRQKMKIARQKWENQRR